MSSTVLTLLTTAAHAADAPAATSDQPQSDIIVSAKNEQSVVGTPEQARLRQRDALNIVNVRSQVDIERLPDFTVAEAARRLPSVSIQSFSNEGRLISIRGLDPELNGVTYEGVPMPAGSSDSAGRAISLDQIPAPLIGGIEVTKSNRPDQDATALGGVVNLVMRSMPATGSFADITLGGGYEDLYGKGLFEGTIVAGTHFGAKRADGTQPFSLLVTATHNEDRRIYDDLEPSYIDKAGTPNDALSGLDLRHYEQHRTRFGYGAELGWNVDDNTKLYVKASYSGYKETQSRERLIYGGLTSGLTYDSATPGVYNSNSTEQMQLHKAATTFITRLVKFGGETNLGGAVIDYYGSYARATTDEPINYDATFTNNHTIPVSINNASNPDLPSVTTTNGASPTDYSSFKLTSLSNAQARDDDTEWDGNISVSVPVHVLGGDGVLKTGGNVRLRHRTMNDPTETYGTLPTVYANQVAGNVDKSIYGGTYQLGNTGNPSDIATLINGGTATENITADAISDAQAYLNDNENIYAWYGQYSGTFGKLGILAGVRIEMARGTYRGNTISTASGGIQTATPNSVHQSYTNYFPTVQLRYQLADNLIARAAYSTAIARPTFTQLSATTVVNIGSGTVTTGNPNLKPTTANNFDLSLERYLPHGGILSVGVFDKEFKNYIASLTALESYAGITGTATVSTYTNLKSAHARGVEFSYHQQFDFLPGLLAGLGFSADYTHTMSRSNFRNTDETLPYTAKDVFNIGESFTHGRFDLQVDESYAGLTLRTLGTTVAKDIYIQPYFQLDIGAHFQLTKRISIYAQARNLNSAKFQTTETADPARLTGEQLYGATYIGGVTVKL